MSDYLSQEIWVEILQRLNLKSLGKCTCVCKSWKSIITHQSFISDHHTRNLQQDSSLFLHLYRSHKTEFYSIYSDSDQIHNLSVSKFPQYRFFPSRSSRVIGTCNGLVCLADERYIDGATEMIWNPSIRKYVVLPKHTLVCDKSTVLFGFGFDSKNKDFKVIRVMNFSRQQYTLAIYSLASNCWRIITNKTPPFLVSKLTWDSSSQMSVNSVLHWVVSRESNDGQIENFILTFDVVEETFGELMLPQILKESHFYNVSTLKGGDNSQLAVVLSNGSLEYERVFSIWVMREYGVVESWTELMNFNSRRWESMPLRLLALRNSGEVVLYSLCDGFIVVDPMREESQKLLRLPGYIYAFVSNHVESLFLMNQECDDALYLKRKRKRKRMS